MFCWQNWKVFVDIPQLIILVPPLLGLKGNLEMTLASRLSTQVTIQHCCFSSVAVRGSDRHVVFIRVFALFTMITHELLHLA